MEIKIISKEANHKDSMRILKENGLEPLTYQEALANGAELVKLAKGERMWFWLVGKGMDKNGVFLFDSKGNLDAENPEKDDMEHKVRVWSGTNLLSLDVHSDSDASVCGGRFGLDASDEPGSVAPVVVGKAKSSKKNVEAANIEQTKCQMCDYLVSNTVWGEHIERHKKFERLVRELVGLVDR